MGFNRAEPRKLDPANHPCAAAPLTRPWQGVDFLGNPLPSGTVVMEPMAMGDQRLWNQSSVMPMMSMMSMMSISAKFGGFRGHEVYELHVCSTESSGYMRVWCTKIVASQFRNRLFNVCT